MAEKQKFYLSPLLIKLTSRAFWVWLITTAITVYVLWRILEKEPAPEYTPVYTWVSILLWIWGGTALLFIGGNVLIDALGKMVEKANLTINQNNTVSTNTQITGTVGGQK